MFCQILAVAMFPKIEYLVVDGSDVHVTVIQVTLVVVESQSKSQVTLTTSDQIYFVGSKDHHVVSVVQS
jgi:hypothetical protein